MIAAMHEYSQCCKMLRYSILVTANVVQCCIYDMKTFWMTSRLVARDRVVLVRDGALAALVAAMFLTVFWFVLWLTASRPTFGDTSRVYARGLIILGVLIVGWSYFRRWKLGVPKAGTSAEANGPVTTKATSTPDATNVPATTVVPSMSWLVSGLLWGVCLVGFSLPCFDAWTYAEHFYSAVFGYLPFSDAANYYSGALKVLATGTLDDWTSRRPVNGLFLAVRLAFTGGDLQASLLLQSIITGTAAFLWARLLWRQFGPGAAIATVGILMQIAWAYMPTTLSEPLGMTLGLLAAVLLWGGVWYERRWQIIAGIACLSVAFVTRPGPILILPILVVWVVVVYAHRWRVPWRMLGAAAAALFIGMVLQMVLLQSYSSGAGLGNSNFALTAYGLSVGTPDWQRLMEDYPQVIDMTEEQQSRFAYARVAENIRHHPQWLCQGLYRGGRQFIVGSVWDCLGAVWLGFRNVSVLLLLGLLAGACSFLWINRKYKTTSLFVALILGICISAPVIYPDGLFRVFIASTPLWFLFAAMALCDPRKRQLTKASVAGGPEGSAAAVLASVIVVLVLVGPAIAAGLNAKHFTVATGDQANEVVFHGQISANTPHADIYPDNIVRRSWAPAVALSDVKDIHLDIQQPCTIALLVAQKPDGEVTRHWLIGPLDFVTKQYRSVEIRGTVEQRGWFTVVHVQTIRDDPVHTTTSPKPVPMK